MTTQRIHRIKGVKTCANEGCMNLFAYKTDRALYCSEPCHREAGNRLARERYANDPEYREYQRRKNELNNKKRTANRIKAPYERERHCDFCERSYLATNPAQRYCSDSCFKEVRKKRALSYYYRDHRSNKMRYRLSSYTLSFEEYLDMYVNQAGCCAICGCEFASHHDYTIKIDHCHKSNTVRGLLCNKCNSGLHYIENDEFVASARLYLERG